MCGEGNPPTAKASNPKTQGGRRHPATLRKGRQAKDIEGKRGKEGKKKGGKEKKEDNKGKEANQPKTTQADRSGSTGWTKSTPARHPHSAKAPPYEPRGKRSDDPGLRLPNLARKKDKQSIKKNIKKANEGPPQPPATPQAEAQGPSGHQRKRQ
jgi:hypothetical protein